MEEDETPIVVSYDRHPGTGHVLVARLDEDAPMRIDGRLDESAWADLEVHDDFRLIDPDTLEPAVLPTELVMFYNDRGLYVGARMTQDPDTLVEYLSGRDQGFLNRDYFSFTLDTSGEGRYGFWFQLNLGDSKSDGTILPTRNYDFSWDGAWWGATARTDTGWSAEFFGAVVAGEHAEGERHAHPWASSPSARLPMPTRPTPGRRCPGPSRSSCRSSSGCR